MGVIGESLLTYAQPLLDDTDGSHVEINNALSIAQLCWNLALLPEKEQKNRISEMGPTLGMDSAEFVDFHDTVIVPMIERHREMFPKMSSHATSPQVTAQRTAETTSSPPRRGKYPGTGRNEPCPCGSGTKYKRCCAKL